MTHSPRYPMAICLSLLGDACFLGHLDLARLVDRSLRRSGLPVQYSQGFNPKQRISFTDALPVGVGSEGEWIGVILDQDLAPDGVRAALGRVLPECVTLIDVRRGHPPRPAGPVRYRLDVLEHERSATDALSALLRRDAGPDRPADAPFRVTSGDAVAGGLTVTLAPLGERPPRPGPVARALGEMARAARLPAPVFGAFTKLCGRGRLQGDDPWPDEAEAPPLPPFCSSTPARATSAGWRSSRVAS